LLASVAGVLLSVVAVLISFTPASGRSFDSYVVRVLLVPSMALRCKSCQPLTETE
jgi:hypothetical protein